MKHNDLCTNVVLRLENVWREDFNTIVCEDFLFLVEGGGNVAWFCFITLFFVSPPLVTAPPPSENLWRKKKTQEVISCILSVKSC